jgi:RNA polymerase sigma factor (TIGR02999 family)
MKTDTAGVTEFLERWSKGDREALRHVIPLMYEELRKAARSRLRYRKADQTLQTTALINEAYLRLSSDKVVPVRGRLHFVGIAAQAMRWILVDYERSRLAAKRGGGITCVSLDQSINAKDDGEPDVAVLALDQALQRLTELDYQQGQIVELRYFGGLSIEETAQYLDLSPATVKRAWASARAWLLRELSDSKATS